MLEAGTLHTRSGTFDVIDVLEARAAVYNQLVTAIPPPDREPEGHHLK